MNIKILLVEDHDIVRQGIKLLLEGQEGITIVGEASNGSEALTQIRTLNPDLILMDMNMPIMNGLEATRRIKIEFPGKKVLVLSMHDHESYLIDMLDAGANGYVLKSTNKDELLFAIRKIANDGMYMGAEFTINMLSKFKSATGFIPSKIKPDLKITEREMDVLVRIAEGKTNQQIAEELFTSVRTIETRRKNLLEKTGTNNTATLIKYAVLNGLVQ